MFRISSNTRPGDKAPTKGYGNRAAGNLLSTSVKEAATGEDEEWRGIELIEKDTKSLSGSEEMKEDTRK